MKQMLLLYDLIHEVYKMCPRRVVITYGKKVLASAFNPAEMINGHSASAYGLEPNITAQMLERVNVLGVKKDVGAKMLEKNLDGEGLIRHRVTDGSPYKGTYVYLSMVDALGQIHTYGFALTEFTGCCGLVTAHNFRVSGHPEGPLEKSGKFEVMSRLIGIVSSILGYSSVSCVVSELENGVLYRRIESFMRGFDDVKDFTWRNRRNDHKLLHLQSTCT